jgi:preprotein translocase subunit SecA
MIIGTIIAAGALFKDQTPNEDEVQRLIDKSIERAFNENQKTEKPQPYRSEPKTGRNEPCPCGSGKKYKRCCLRSI